MDGIAEPRRGPGRPLKQRDEVKDPLDRLHDAAFALREAVVALDPALAVILNRTMNEDHEFILGDVRRMTVAVTTATRSMRDG